MIPQVAPLVAVRFAAVLIVASVLPTQQPVGGPDFAREVRPILSDNCFACHGPDAATRKADLRLDQHDGLLTVVVPGDLEASELVRRILHQDPEERMPPAESGHELTDAQRQTLVAWVDAGAPWDEHWAFRSLPGEVVVPQVAGKWARNPIDRFVAARLADDELTPSAEADPATLVRRVFLDLTGLPPSPEDVRAFLADTAPDRYEQLVDRLLGSPRYAEHMARQWLDVARYGDTHGLHLDNYREAWPYRDWVIDAFANDLPYDQFAIRQLAGDLLPDATLEDRIATGFLRCNVSTSEGGSIVEEVHVRNVVDRTDTFGTVFLGLTAGCAVCHDHKFDPLTQRDYYSLFAFFNSIDGPAMDQNAKDHAPVVKVPSDEDRRRLAEVDAKLEGAKERIAAALAEIDYAEPPAPEALPAADFVWVDDDAPEGNRFVDSPFEWVSQPVFSGERAMRRAGEGLHQHFLDLGASKLRVGAGDELFAHVWIDPTDPPREIMLQWLSDAVPSWEHRAFWGEDLIQWGDGETASRRRLGALPATGRWVRLEVPIAEVGLSAGSVVHSIAFTQHGGKAVWDAAGLRTATPQQPVERVWIDDDTPVGARRQGDGKTWDLRAPAGGAEPATAFAGALALRRSGGGGLNQDFFTEATDTLVVHAGDRLFAHVWLDPKDPPQGIQLQFNDGNWNHRARWGAACHGAGAANGADFVAGDLPATGEWVRLEVAIEDVGLSPGAVLNGWAFTQTGGTVWWDAAGVRTWGSNDQRHLHSLEAWIARAAADQGLAKGLREAAAAADRSPAQAKLLRDHFLRYVHVDSQPIFQPLEAELAQLREQRQRIDAAIPTSLVWKEKAEPEAAHVLRRGEYDQKGDVVTRATPSWLPPMAGDLPRDRLGLARWLVDPEHPLTARVAVNRFWQQVFGIGLVKTAEDFGSQGEPPSHPELLDWLARRFVDSGWSVRELMRAMVTSSTYRQASDAAPEMFRRDPRNRLLARGSRHRLDAEVLRDQALFVSGLLVDQIGGPPVKPPQPDGLWKAVAYVGSNTDTFRGDTDPAKTHRRSLYTFFKRTAPPPQMSTLDAPSRESCVVRRERTNTPLQALLLMNDPQYVECARALAERTIREEGDPATWATAMFERATLRQPSAEELRALTALADSQLAHFAADPTSAQQLIAIGTTTPDPSLDPATLATWTVVANLVLNLDEFVSRQ